MAAAKLTPVDYDPFNLPGQQSSSIVGAEEVPGLPKIVKPTKDTGELSQAGLDVANSLKSFGAYMSTNDPKAIQDIVLKNIKGSSGGEDENGPYVVIDNKPFYINKPGLSGADAVGFLGDMIKFLPVGKVASLLKGGLSRVIVAAGGSAAVSGGSEITSKIAGSEQPFDVVKVGLDTVFGAAGQKLGDVIQAFAEAKRPVMDAAGNYTQEFLSQVNKAGINLADYGEQGLNTIFQAYKTLGRAFAGQANKIVAGARQAEGDVFNIPLTKGQVTGDVRQIAKEEAMRQGGRGGYAQSKMLDFQAKQRQAIGGAVENQLGQKFAPNVGVFPGQQEAGGQLLEMLKRRAGEAKAAGKAAYEAVDQEGVRIAQKAFSGLEPKVRTALQESDVVMSETLTPKSMEMFKRVQSIFPQTGEATLTSQSLKAIEKVRRELNVMAKGARDADSVAAKQIINSFDDWLDDAVQTGLVSGDAANLDLLKQARSLWKNYKQTYQSVDTDAKRIITKIVDDDLSPTETMNLIFGSAKLGDKQASMRVVKQLKETLGANSPEFENLVSAGFTKLFKDTQGNMKPPATMVRELDELIMGKGAGVAKELFTEDQMKLLKDFRASVSKTVTPAEATNPSKTGYEIARLFEDLVQAMGIAGAVKGTVTGSPLATGASATLLGAKKVRPFFDVRSALSQVPGVSNLPQFNVNLGRIGQYNFTAPGGASLGVATGGLLSPE